MAELSNEGSGVVDVTCSASTLPSACTSGTQTGSAGRMAASTSARCSSTGTSGGSAWEPGHELPGHVGPLDRELDQGAQVVHLVAGVVATAAEQHAVHAPAVGRVHLGQGLERVGELDLAA